MRFFSLPPSLPPPSRLRVHPALARTRTFHNLIAERYERTATILTSNLHFDEWGAAFAANKMIGAATLDRLRHGAYKLVLDGDSYRALPPASEVSKPPAEKGRKAAPL